LDLSKGEELQKAPRSETPHRKPNQRRPERRTYSYETGGLGLTQGCDYTRKVARSFDAPARGKTGKDLRQGHYTSELAAEEKKVQKVFGITKA